MMVKLNGYSGWKLQSRTYELLNYGWKVKTPLKQMDRWMLPLEKYKEGHMKDGYIDGEV